MQIFAFELRFWETKYDVELGKHYNYLCDHRFTVWTGPFGDSIMSA